VIAVQYDPNPKQAKFHENDSVEVVYGGAKGGGKAQPLDSMIPTPHGWKTMGELVTGDYVFGDDGVPKRVLWTTNVMYNHNCYKLIFDDGTEIICDEDHLWHTYTAKDMVAMVRRTEEFRSQRRAKRSIRGSGKRPDLSLSNSMREYQYLNEPAGLVRTTKEISETLYTSSKQCKQHNHAVRVAEALVLPDKDLEISPYMFGVWLGDGCSNSSLIATDDQEILEYLIEDGYEIVKNKSKYMYRITGLITKLKHIGVANNKHIPMDYKRASITQRLLLLQGLMDTDGYARPHGGVEFATTSLTLAEDVREIIVSLGWKVTIKEGIAKGVLQAKIDIQFFGRETRPVYKMLQYANDPIIPGITGRESS